LAIDRDSIGVPPRFSLLNAMHWDPNSMIEAALLCPVVGISDGDTLKVRCTDQPQMVVRLAEIDAPEKAQPYGQRSKEWLSTLCFKQQAQVRPVSRNRYRRTVARVICTGH
jgi:endonuclease YncB( thermonuclease family)